jgi:hypothetical protein
VTKVQHPEVTVRLVGTDGNAFSVLGKVQRALREAGVSDEEVSAFHAEAITGGYDELLQTCMRWVNII